jgi:agmatinase
VAASHVAYELVTLMADNAAEGNRFGADTGYAAQALGQEARRPAGFSASSPLVEPVETGISRQSAGALK